MNDRKIISAIAARDERTFALVIQKYSGLLWKIAASVLINAASAQDVEECVADVFIYLWQFPEKYDPEKGKLSSWLCLVARSRALDRYRRIARKREISLEEIMTKISGYGGEDADGPQGLWASGIQGYAEAAEPERQERLKNCEEPQERVRPCAGKRKGPEELRLCGEEPEEWESLRLCMEELEEQDRELVIRRYYYEQKPAEIAAAFGLSKKQVENRLYYVKRKLRKRMEKQEGGKKYGKI
ncbi:MAG: sigma-70 family RNA polymerase sigma factor [bacterium]|nr:sigma-70 family RNA polymerase sigma factor [bacterium]